MRRAIFLSARDVARAVSVRPLRERQTTYELDRLDWSWLARVTLGEEGSKGNASRVQGKR